MNILEEIEKEFYDYQARYGVEPKSILFGRKKLIELALWVRGCGHVPVTASTDLIRLLDQEPEESILFMGMKLEFHKDMKPDVFYVS